MLHHRLWCLIWIFAGLYGCLFLALLCCGVEVLIFYSELRGYHQDDDRMCYTIALMLDFELLLGCVLLAPVIFVLWTKLAGGCFLGRLDLCWAVCLLVSVTVKIVSSSSKVLQYQFK